MTETRATAMNMVNKALASLCTTLDHDNREIQEIQKTQGIHIRTLNEMNQNLNVILQKLSSQDSHSHSPQRTGLVNHNFSAPSIARFVKLDFPCFQVTILPVRLIKPINILAITKPQLQKNF